VDNAEVVMRVLGVVGLLVAAVVTGLAQPDPDTLWTRTYGTIWNDQATAIRQTADGGYIIGGLVGTGDNTNDGYLVKTDSLGNLEWSHSYGGVGDDRIFSVCQADDGGYAFAGVYGLGGTNSSGYLAKTDSEGGISWERTFGWEYDEFEEVIQTEDGGFAAVGWTWTFGPNLVNCFLAKVDQDGDTSWTSYLDGGEWDYGLSLDETSDGGFVVAGESFSYGANGFYDFLLMKTNSRGTLQWGRVYGGSEWEMANCVRETNDLGFILVGFTESYGSGFRDIYVVKTNSVGATLWTRVIGGPGDDVASFVQQTPDRGYIISGWTQIWGPEGFQFCLLKLDSTGREQWIRTYGGFGDDWCNEVNYTTDGGFVLAGESYSFGGGDSDFYVVKTGSDSLSSFCRNGRNVPPVFYTLHPAYPNPFNQNSIITYETPIPSRIRIAVYNVLGLRTAVLVDGMVVAGSHDLLWDARGLPSGVYFVRMEAGGFQQTQKIVLLK
jgi:hypothetical protein